MPDTAHLAVIDGRPSLNTAVTEAAEDARRWFDRAESCERQGCMYRHCIAMAEEAMERAGLKVIGDISAIVVGEEK